MAVVEGKTPAERNKMIAAVVLGAVALIALAYMFLGSSSKPSTSGVKQPKTSSTSASSRPPALTPEKVREEGFIPTKINDDLSTPSVPEAGRNIFAFYVPPERPKPDPNATPVIKPTPTPKPPSLILASISPVNVYAHTGDFTLDVTGDKFTPETHIFIGGAELPTRFVSPQQLSTKVPAQLLSFEGGREIIVRSRDGQLFSNTATLNVMPAPVPNYVLIGVTIRTHGSDTAILKEKNGKDLLNLQRGDLLGGRFRITSISRSDVTLTDTALKIKHTLPLTGDNSNPGAPGQPRYSPPPQPPAADDDPEP